MLRAEKGQVVDGLHDMFATAGVVVVTHYKGLNVAQMNDLRRQMRAAGGSLKVAKNRLVRRALEDTPYKVTSDLFEGPTAIGVSDDPTVAPKVLAGFSKRNDKLAILGGGLEGSLLTAEQVRALAELPSLDELRARLIGLVNAPASKLVRVLNEPGGKLARVMQARADQEQAG